jgi:hypothetical protein
MKGMLFVLECFYFILPPSAFRLALGFDQPDPRVFKYLFRGNS